MGPTFLIFFRNMKTILVSVSCFRPTNSYPSFPLSNLVCIVFKIGSQYGVAPFGKYPTSSLSLTLLMTSLTYETMYRKRCSPSISLRTPTNKSSDIPLVRRIRLRRETFCRKTTYPGIGPPTTLPALPPRPSNTPTFAGRSLVHPRMRSPHCLCPKLSRSSSELC